MKLLYERYTGMLARCPNCFALIGYAPEDVSVSQNIKCPKCSFNMWVPFNPNYDGVVKEDGKSDSNK